MSDESKFDQFCIVELFGHQRIAGKVSEQVIAGQGFVRVDVPEVVKGGVKRPGYTKLYGSGAIYAITPTDETTCQLAAANMYQAPVEEYHFRPTVPVLAKSSADDFDPEADANERDDWRVGA